MGANHQKEIEFYCSIASPDYGLITNIGKAHLEGFGGIDGVKKGKAELFQHVINNNGVLFTHSGNKILEDIYNGYEKVIKYGYNENDYITGKIVNDNEFANVIIDDEIKLESHLVGNYNIDNILAAACVGKYFNVGYDEIKAGVENYFPENNRSELKRIGNNSFILDSYNANPSSLKAALENFNSIKATSKIVIMGDMLELGEYAYKEHKYILELAIQLKFDKLITVGPEFLKHQSEQIIQFNNSDETKQWFDQQQFKGATILLKGSRGIRLEKIIQ